MTGLRGKLFGRRRLLAAGAAVAGVGMTYGLRAEPVPVRRDVATLGESSPILAKLEAAIGEMQRRSQRDPHDPKGWRAHALEHDAVCAAVSNSDDAQVHGCWWFLPWHRAFLAVTEWKLRAISGDPSLALPYWNWSSDRRIPGAFARAGSALADAVRHSPNRTLTDVEVDWLTCDPAVARLGVAGLAAASFEARTEAEIPRCFGGIARPNAQGWHGRSRLETVPHNAIHGYVGGEAADGSVGNMTELATAAFDPVFYAHHGNLDRLWEIWRADPHRRRTEPTRDAFLQHRFPFVWLDGTVVTVSVAEALDTRALGYVYDSLAVFREGAAPVATPPDAASRQPVASMVLAVPRGAGDHTLHITGVQPGERPITVEFVLARPKDPASAISVGAYAVGRRHAAPSIFPDTDLRFDVGSALRTLNAESVQVLALPLSLGPDGLPPPPFTYAAMSLERSSG